MKPEPAPAAIPVPPLSGPVPGAAADPDADRSIVRRLWDVFRREPMLLVTCSYLFVSIVGLWDLYWFYRRFDIPILEFLQSSDYFVAGLRRPAYAGLLAWTLLVAALSIWPQRWRMRHPERAARLDRRWWFRAFFPRRGDWWAYFGLHPETTATLTALVVMAMMLFHQSDSRADAIRAGGGNAVQVEDGQGRIAGDWRMLGTSSAYVFLWDPAEQRALVLPIESIAGIRPLASGIVAAAPGAAPPASPAGEGPR